MSLVANSTRHKNRGSGHLPLLSHLQGLYLMTRSSIISSIGHDVSDCGSVDEQIAAAGLDWHIELSPVAFGEDFSHQSSAFKAAYRSDTNKLIDIYGPRRKPFDNRKIVEHFNQFCESSDLSLSRLGCLNGGTDVVAVAPLKWEMDVKAIGDVTKAYVVLRESHLCGHSLTLVPYTERLVCMNGMTIFRREAQLKISHFAANNVSKIDGLLEQIRVSLTNYRDESEHLANTELTDAEAQMQLIAAFGEPGKVFQDQPKPVKLAYQLYMGQGLGSSSLSAYNTAYGLLESVKEAQGWHGFRSSYSSVESRFGAIAFGGRNQKIQKFRQQLVSVYAHA